MAESSTLPRANRIPLWLKLLWTAWVAVWAYYYGRNYGLQNFLWFCDLANFLICAGLWLESPLILSWQAVSVLLVQLIWVIDLAVRLVAGFHPFRATGYMFKESNPIHMRLLSLFHAVVPAILIWGLWRFKYDRRAFLLQCVTAWIVLPICFLGWNWEKDINWVWGPFDERQTLLHPWVYFGLCMLGYPLILFLPSHLLFAWLPWFRPPRPDSASPPARP